MIGADPVVSGAVAREVGLRLWHYLPPGLREALRELVHADPSLGWGVALAEGLARHALPGVDGEWLPPAGGATEGD
jgi:hypothetical protein